MATPGPHARIVVEIGASAGCVDLWVTRELIWDADWMSFPKSHRNVPIQFPNRYRRFPTPLGTTGGSTGKVDLDDLQDSFQGNAIIEVVLYCCKDLIKLNRQVVVGVVLRGEGAGKGSRGYRHDNPYPLR